MSSWRGSVLQLSWVPAHACHTLIISVDHPLCNSVPISYSMGKQGHHVAAPLGGALPMA